jgi:hypothetical protein
MKREVLRDLAIALSSVGYAQPTGPADYIGIGEFDVTSVIEPAHRPGDPSASGGTTRLPPLAASPFAPWAIETPQMSASAAKGTAASAAL